MFRICIKNIYSFQVQNPMEHLDVLLCQIWKMNSERIFNEHWNMQRLWIAKSIYLLYSLNNFISIFLIFECFSLNRIHIMAGKPADFGAADETYLRCQKTKKSTNNQMSNSCENVTQFVFLVEICSLQLSNWYRQVSLV